MDHYPTSNSALIESLKLVEHPEGGYFVETDRQPAEIPSPFAGEATQVEGHQKETDGNRSRTEVAGDSDLLPVDVRQPRRGFPHKQVFRKSLSLSHGLSCLTSGLRNRHTTCSTRGGPSTL